MLTTQKAVAATVRRQMSKDRQPPCVVAYPEGYHEKEWLAIGSLFMPGKKPSKITAHCALTAQVPIAQAVEITDLATRLGISRHKTLLLVIGAGVSVIAAQVVPAVVQQQG